MLLSNDSRQFRIVVGLAIKIEIFLSNSKLKSELLKEKAHPIPRTVFLIICKTLNEMFVG